MIAILEDKKGFRKEVYMVHPYPEYRLAEFDGYGFISKEGLVDNQSKATRKIIFDYVKHEGVFDMTIALYKER